LFLTRELTEVNDDDICSVRSEVNGVISSFNTNNKSEPAGTPCLYADDGVFEDGGASGRCLELPSRFQEHVRRRLARKAEPSKIDAVYANVKELGEARRFEHRRTVLRR
jgi:hypothetical protein